MTLVVRDCGRVEYGTALGLQESLVQQKLAGDSTDYLLLLEHHPVYTLGRGANPADLLGADRKRDIPVFRVSRGGGATYHGPGQLVAYPILKLGHGGRDVHRYVRTLEEVLISVCTRFHVACGRRDGLTGVWTQSGKIASIGVGVRRWVTFHGVALNVEPDLTYFQQIVPCRMPSVSITSIARELGMAPAMAAIRQTFLFEFLRTFGIREVAVEQAA